MKRLAVIVICVLIGIYLSSCKDEPGGGTPTEDAGVEDTLEEDVQDDVADTAGEEDVQDTSEEDVADDAAPQDTGPDVDPDAEWYVSPEDDLFFVHGQTREYTFNFEQEPGAGEVTLEMRPPLGVTATPAEIVDPPEQFVVSFETSANAGVSDSARLEISGTNGVSELDIFFDAQVRKPRLGRPDSSYAPNGGALVVGSEVSEEWRSGKAWGRIQGAHGDPDDPGTVFLHYRYKEPGQASTDFQHRLTKAENGQALPSYGGTGTFRDLFPASHNPHSFSFVDLDEYRRGYFVALSADINGTRQPNAFLYRLTSAGTLDATFGSDGIVDLGVADDEGGRWDSGTLFDDAHFMVFGSFARSCCGTGDRRFPMYAKYLNGTTPNAGRELTFGGAGDGYAYDARANPPENEGMWPEDVLALPDGEFVVALADTDSVKLERYDQAGKPTAWSAAVSELSAYRLSSRLTVRLLADAAATPRGFALVYDEHIRFYGLNGEETAWWGTSENIQLPRAAEQALITENQLLVITGNPAAGYELNIYPATWQQGDPVPTAPARPQFALGQGWEYRTAPRLIAADETFAWLAGVVQRARTDGDYDLHILVWRAWLTPWGE